MIHVCPELPLARANPAVAALLMAPTSIVPDLPTSQLPSAIVPYSRLYRIHNCTALAIPSAQSSQPRHTTLHSFASPERGPVNATSIQHLPHSSSPELPFPPHFHPPSMPAFQPQPYQVSKCTSFSTTLCTALATPSVSVSEQTPRPN